MSYTRIDDLPEDVASLVSSELEALGKVWLEKKVELENTGEYAEFVKRLQREWAIETGLIERLYTWDRGVTEVLIEQGISEALIAHSSRLDRPSAQQAKNLIEDQLAIAEGLFSVVKGEEPINETFIRGLQARFAEHQDTVEAMTPEGTMILVPLLKGEYKKLPNNPRREDGSIHEYCPAEFVKDEMQRLVDGYRAHEATCAPEVLSAWLHHRFAQIHPFQDGNGRVARTLASLVFLRAGLFPLVIRDSDRNYYIAALEEADGGNLKPLVNLFTRRQKDSILRALGIEQQVQRSHLAEDIIASGLSQLKSRHTESAQEAKKLTDTADHLCAIASDRMEQLVEKLSDSLRDLTPIGTDHYHANTKSADNKSPNRHYFWGQVIEVARQSGYFANSESYRSWARLAIATSSVFELVVSLHGYGYGNSGVIVGSAFSFQRIPREEGGTDVVDVRPASADLLQFNYAEDVENVNRRFKEWLEESLAIGLTDWRRSIES